MAGSEAEPVAAGVGIGSLVWRTKSEAGGGWAIVVGRRNSGRSGYLRDVARRAERTSVEDIDLLDASIARRVEEFGRGIRVGCLFSVDSVGGEGVIAGFWGR